MKILVVGAGGAKIHVVLCNHGVERPILQLYVRLPGGGLSVTYTLQHTSNQGITHYLSYLNTCQVVCFFIGPGR